MTSSVYSFSALTTYEECPYKYYRTYVLRDRTPFINDSFAIGEGLHKVAQELAKNINLTLPECVKLYYDTALAHPALKNKDAVSECMWMVEAHFRYPHKIKPLVVNGELFVEKKFKLEIAPGIFITGFIDVVSEKISVVDYKSSATKYSKKLVEHPFKSKGFQISVYSLAVFELLGVIPSMGGFFVWIKDIKYFLKHKTNIQRLGFPVTKEIVEGARNKIIRMHNEIVTRKDFPSYTHSANCFWCPYKGFCS